MHAQKSRRRGQELILHHVGDLAHDNSEMLDRGLERRFNLDPALNYCLLVRQISHVVRLLDDGAAV